LVFFEQVPELAHRGLVRYRLAAQINAHEPPHHRRVVQRLFYRRIRQVEPLLQKINPQQLLKSSVVVEKSLDRKQLNCEG
jgi:hypothetical protein